VPRSSSRAPRSRVDGALDPAMLAAAAATGRYDPRVWQPLARFGAPG
jgi:hypothetical protein